MGGSQEGLSGSWSQLQDSWAEAREQWRDSVGYRFEREWWLQIEEVVPRLLEAMAEVDEVLSNALAED